MARWIVCLTVALSLLAVAVEFGVLQRALFSDQTGIVWIICTLGVIGTISCRWFPVLNDWLCEHGIPLLFGLLGTVAGFMAAISGVVDSDVLQKMAGIETALSTTATGLVVHLYLLVMQRLNEP